MLSGQIIQPKSRKANSIVVLLHGYGSNSQDAAWGLRRLSELFPETVFVAPDAPTPCATASRAGTYQWFPISTTRLDDYGEVMRDAVPIVRAFIYQQLDDFQLQEKDLIIGGFSQGAMMSIGAGLSLAQSCAGVLAYSGAFAMPQDFKICAKPKIMLVHGNQDDVVPFELMNSTKNLLEHHLINVKTLVCDGVRHSINLRGFSAGKQFIEQALGNREEKYYGTK